MSYHIFSSYDLHVLQNIQMQCINVFLIVNRKIHTGFWNEEGLAESRYGFVIKSLFVNRILRTISWNIFKIFNFIAKRK